MIPPIASWYNTNHGDIAQLGEHLLDVQEVAGSSPVVSMESPADTDRRVSAGLFVWRLAGRADQNGCVICSVRKKYEIGFEKSPVLLYTRVYGGQAGPLAWDVTGSLHDRYYRKRMVLLWHC